MMSKPKYIILTGLFCCVVVGRASHFYSFFSVNVLARVDFFMTTMAFGLGRPSQAQAKNKKKINLFLVNTKNISFYVLTPEITDIFNTFDEIFLYSAKKISSLYTKKNNNKK